ncbi:MAG: class I SAM-dependent methyltransferase [Pirellulaceae bacterium]
MDKGKIDAFWSGRTAIADPRLATNYRDDGRLEIDFKLVSAFAHQGDRILDLGAGGCTLACKLLPLATEVVAVDKYAGFLKKAPAHMQLTPVCCDVVDYFDNSQYDEILLFGVANFLTDEELYKLCQNATGMLAPQGTFIAKHQCGIDQEVIVDRFSEELGCHYHARYPSVKSQENLFSEFFCVEVLDVYPPDLNRWPDTHFYAFICTPRNK